MASLIVDAVQPGRFGDDQGHDARLEGGSGALRLWIGGDGRAGVGRRWDACACERCERDGERTEEREHLSLASWSRSDLAPRCVRDKVIGRWRAVCQPARCTSQ